MGSWFHWTVFFAAGLTAILLAKVLDERDRQRRARQRKKGSVPPPAAVPAEGRAEEGSVPPPPESP